MLLFKYLKILLYICVFDLWLNNIKRNSMKTGTCMDLLFGLPESVLFAFEDMMTCLWGRSFFLYIIWGQFKPYLKRI